jgi:hypothetical protein
MLSRLLVVILASLLGSVAFTGPAAPAVTIPGCGEFLVVARDLLFLEQGVTNLVGNLIVTAQNGRLQVGRFNVVHGTVSANTIEFGNNAAIDRCEFNVALGVNPATVCNAIAPFTFPTCVPDALFTAPAVDSCVNSAADFTVPAGQVRMLADGDCVRVLRLGRDSVLGVNGTIDVRQLQAGIGARIVGPATLNVLNGITAEARFSSVGITFNVAGTTNGAVTFGNDALFENTLLNVPVGGVHIRFSSTFSGNTGVIARLASVQPIALVLPPPLLACPCVRSLAFTPPGAVTLMGEELTAITEVRATLGSCDPAAGTVVPFSTPSDTEIDVDVSGLAPGTYKIITLSAGGSCCTAATFTRP